VSSSNDKLIFSDSEPLVNMCTKPSSQIKEHKIVLIGHSHAKDCRVRVKNLVNDKCDISHFVKLGSGADILTKSAKNDVRNLTKSYVIVFWGGANDVSKNNSMIGLSHIINFIKDNTHTSIIVLSVPNHYDLMNSSCLNNEISMFTRSQLNALKSSNAVQSLTGDFLKTMDFT
jgi:hypothetical protein